MVEQTGQNLTCPIYVFNERCRQNKHIVKFHCHIIYQFHIYSYTDCPVSPNNGASQEVHITMFQRCQNCGWLKQHVASQCECHVDD